VDSEDLREALEDNPDITLRDIVNRRRGEEHD
jgi:hypothetical protein